MNVATKLVNKRDVNSCVYMVDFPRPGDIYMLHTCLFLNNYLKQI